MAGRFQKAVGNAREQASRFFGAERAWRLVAGLAVGLIAVLAVASMVVGQSDIVPPPVTMRGSVPDSVPRATDGLEFVPAPVVDFRPTTTMPTTPTTISGSEDSPPDAPATTAPASAQSPDEPPTVSSPDDASADSPDDADSLDSPDTPDD